MIAAKEKAERRLTHADEILSLLQDAGSDGVTSEKLLSVTWRFSGRIYDLRQKGWNIQTLDRPGTECARFVLIPGKFDLSQPELFEVRA
jgi:hypothetical protein